MATPLVVDFRPFYLTIHTGSRLKARMEACLERGLSIDGLRKPALLAAWREDREKEAVVVWRNRRAIAADQH